MSKASSASQQVHKKKVEGSADNVRVFVRIRPFIPRELHLSSAAGHMPRPCIRVSDNNTTVTVVSSGVEDATAEPDDDRTEDGATTTAFRFDHAFWSVSPSSSSKASSTSYLPPPAMATQADVYDGSARDLLAPLLEGMNACVFAYGQTGSGKTYTMLGTETEPGITPRLVEELFRRVAEQKVTEPTTQISVECSFFEIYNETVRDLLRIESAYTNRAEKDYLAPRVRQHPRRGVFVEGVQLCAVSDAQETNDLMKNAMLERATASTNMNDTSSRSHAVAQVRITQNVALRGVRRVSTLSLVDLAGSEKIKMSQATGSTLVETKKINLSLTTLRRVVDVLIHNSSAAGQVRPKPAPVRESLLTYLLSNSLGGNSKTMMISTISPHISNLDDTVGTLRYAVRAKDIVNTVKVNEETTAAMLEAMYAELAALKLRVQNGEGITFAAANSSPNTTVSSNAPKLEIPRDVQAELDAREREIAHVKQVQAEMQQVLDEVTQKEGVISKQVRERNEEKEQIDFKFEQRNAQKFAQVFRSAYMIELRRKDVSQAEDLHQKALARRNELQAAVDAIHRQIAAETAERVELENQVVQLRQAAMDTRSSEEKKRVALEVELARVNTECAHIEQRLADRRKCVLEQQVKHAQERRKRSQREARRREVETLQREKEHLSNVYTDVIQVNRIRQRQSDSVHAESLRELNQMKQQLNQLQREAATFRAQYHYLRVCQPSRLRDIVVAKQNAVERNNAEIEDLLEQVRKAESLEDERRKRVERRRVSEAEFSRARSEAERSVADFRRLHREIRMLHPSRVAGT